MKSKCFTRARDLEVWTRLPAKSDALRVSSTATTHHGVIFVDTIAMESLSKGRQEFEKLFDRLQADVANGKINSRN